MRSLPRKNEDTRFTAGYGLNETAEEACRHGSRLSREIGDKGGRGGGRPARAHGSAGGAVPGHSRRVVGRRWMVDAGPVTLFCHTNDSVQHP